MQKGPEVFKNKDPEFSRLLLKKATEAFGFGLDNPGVCQTAPGTAPYFYEEDNWVDDMELAAIELYNLTKEAKYLKYALEFGRKEIVTPWMGADTAKHYQWYPFVNMGHPALPGSRKHKMNLSSRLYEKRTRSHRTKAEKNPFHVGVTLYLVLQ